MQYPPQYAQLGNQIVQIIQTSPESHTTLERIAQTLGETFQADTCFLVAVVNQTPTHPIALWYAAGDSTAPQEHQLQKLAHLMLSDDALAMQPWAICDLQTSHSNQALVECNDVLSVRSMLCFHTKFHSQINGMIILGKAQPHEWTTPEKEQLSVAAQSVAIAFSQVQLTRQALTATRYQTLIHSLSLAIHQSHHLNQALQMVIATIAPTLAVDWGLVLLLSDTDPVLKSHSSPHSPNAKLTVACEWIDTSPNSEPIGSLSHQSFWLSESSLCKQALCNAPEPLIITQRQNGSHCILEQAMLPTGAIIPLITSSTAPEDTHLLGFLVLQQAQPRVWHPDELDVVKWVSTQLSATINQHQTLQQVQSLVDDRTAQLQRSLEAQARLYEKTRQQMDQLQQLNQLKEEFMSSMSHELRTPLTTMSLAIRMLRQPKLPMERRNKYLEILEEQCNKEIDLINDILSLQRLESDQSQIQPQTIDLIELIKEIADVFEGKWASKKLTLTVECPAPSLMLNTDPDSLHRILLELLTNAGKYSEPDTTVELHITHHVKPSFNQVVLTLSNRGPGISPEDLTRIFDKFHRGQGVTQKAVQGTGLGLALVKCLVQQLNGTISVESHPLGQSQTALTSFTVTLPQLHPRTHSLD